MMKDTENKNNSLALISDGCAKDKKSEEVSLQSY